VAEFKHARNLLEIRGGFSSIVTLCWLKGLDLYVGPDCLSSPEGHQGLYANLLQVESAPINIFLGITDRGQLAGIRHDLLLPAVEVPQLTYHQRISCWKKGLGAKSKDLDHSIKECSRRFRLEKDAIKNICEGLKNLAEPVSFQDLLHACRAEVDLDMGELAQKVRPRFSIEELVLPYPQQVQFREIIRAMNALTEVHYSWGTARAWNEGGISVLFSGPPGTGKTMAAEVLADTLKLPMFRIDLSQIVNKYIGETEKNLKKIFDAAEVCDLILFFDEADSLFGRRSEVKDAHDRYANLEISYLLERMERFKGLAVLATNRKKDLDQAFMRRLRFIVDFPLPGPEQRLEIWRRAIPEAVDRSRIDLDFLARQFPLAGGYIRSIIFNACLQSANGKDHDPSSSGASLDMETLIISVKREYDKINRSISLGHFGPYAEIVRKMEHQDATYQH
jgi:hypothetical protein